MVSSLGHDGRSAVSAARASETSGVSPSDVWILPRPPEAGSAESDVLYQFILLFLNHRLF